MDPTGGVRESLSHRVGGQVDSLATKKKVLLQNLRAKSLTSKLGDFPLKA